MSDRLLLRSVRTLIWAVGIWPLSWLLWRGASASLGPDPGKVVVDELGIWALRLLLMTLAVRPMAELVRRPVLFRIRRPTGLFALAYALLHATAALLYLLGWRWSELVDAIAERQYVLFGVAALLLLVPLGLTSTRQAQRRLGRRWRQLHRLVYPAAVMAALHFLWLIRSDFAEPLIYFIITLLLLGYRGRHWMRRFTRFRSP